MGHPHPPSARAPHVYLTASPYSLPDQTRTTQPRLSRLPRLSGHASLASLRQRAARQNAVKLTHMAHPRLPSAGDRRIHLTEAPCFPPDWTRTRHPRLSRLPRLSGDAGLASRRQRPGGENAVKLTHMARPRLPSAQATNVHLTARARVCV